jgi:hypothetical protein
MMPTLPNGFMPVVSGYTIDEPGGVMRTDVAGGAPRYAMEWDRGTQRFQVTLILDAAGFSAWTVFYHLQIGKGSLAFLMPLDSGLGVLPHQVNIMPGSYSAVRSNGEMVVVSFVAEAENQVYLMTAADGQALLEVYNQYGSDANSTLARIAQFANVDTLVLQ